ncbi:MAG: hypothetical protein RLZ12_473 [Bacillota bacterium]|jgi:hypothetical protein
MRHMRRKVLLIIGSSLLLGGVTSTLAMRHKPAPKPVKSCVKGKHNWSMSDHGCLHDGCPWQDPQCSPCFGNPRIQAHTHKLTCTKCSITTKKLVKTVRIKGVNKISVRDV